MVIIIEVMIPITAVLLSTGVGISDCAPRLVLGGRGCLLRAPGGGGGGGIGVEAAADPGDGPGVGQRGRRGVAPGARPEFHRLPRQGLQTPL